MTTDAAFTGDDLEQLAALVADGWRSAADRDWARPAGGLEWSCARTADHAVDTTVAPAFFLASRRTDRYPEGGWSPGVDASPADLADGLEMAARLMASVVAGTPADVGAVIWRRPTVEVRPPADFPPRAGLELALHAHDVALGLGIPFAPPAPLVDRLRRHTASWPMWELGGTWSAPTLAGDPWEDLLRSSGRTATA